MLPEPLAQAERRAEAFSHRLALEAAGVLCGAIGAGFLTVAAWLALIAIGDARFAALVIGAFYSGAGLLFWAIALRRKATAHRRLETDDPYKPFADIAQGFATGLKAGRTAARPEPR